MPNNEKLEKPINATKSDVKCGMFNTQAEQRLNWIALQITAEISKDQTSACEILFNLMLKRNRFTNEIKTAFTRKSWTYKTKSKREIRIEKLAAFKFQILIQFTTIFLYCKMFVLRGCLRIEMVYDLDWSTILGFVHKMFAKITAPIDFLIIHFQGSHRNETQHDRNIITKYFWLLSLCITNIW